MTPRRYDRRSVKEGCPSTISNTRESRNENESGLITANSANAEVQTLTQSPKLVTENNALQDFDKAIVEMEVDVNKKVSEEEVQVFRARIDRLTKVISETVLNQAEDVKDTKKWDYIHWAFNKRACDHVNAAVEVINRFQAAHESVRDLTADIQLLQRNLVNRMELMERTRHSQLDAARKALDKQKKIFDNQRKIFDNRQREMQDIITEEQRNLATSEEKFITEMAKKERLLKESKNKLDALEKTINSYNERPGITSTSMFPLAVEPGRPLLKGVPGPVLAISQLKPKHDLPPQVSCRDREGVKFGTSSI
jgi:hypothetical protein